MPRSKTTLKLRNGAEKVLNRLETLDKNSWCFFKTIPQQIQKNFGELIGVYVISEFWMADPFIGSTAQTRAQRNRAPAIRKLQILDHQSRRDIYLLAVLGASDHLCRRWEIEQENLKFEWISKVLAGLVLTDWSEENPDILVSIDPTNSFAKDLQSQFKTRLHSTRDQSQLRERLVRYEKEAIESLAQQGIARIEIMMGQDEGWVVRIFGKVAVGKMTALEKAFMIERNGQVLRIDLPRSTNQEKSFDCRLPSFQNLIKVLRGDATT